MTGLPRESRPHDEEWAAPIPTNLDETSLHGVAELADRTRVTEDGPTMTRGDRAELVKVVKKRARVARSSVAQREAEVLADFEAQLSAKYRIDDAAWSEVTAAAEAAIEIADAEVSRRCDELGIKPEFRPGIVCGWYGRGENAMASRRAELRRTATTRIAATGKAAKAAIETAECEVLESLWAAGLTTQTARDFLGSMPTAQALMPIMRLAELESGQGHNVRSR